MNNGQVCAALKRLYVPESIYDELCEQLVDAAQGVKMGNGMDEGVQQGPLANKMQYEKVLDLLEDAKANGGRVLWGEVGAQRRGGVRGRQAWPPCAGRGAARGGSRAGEGRVEATTGIEPVSTDLQSPA